MTLEEAKALRESWGDQPCDHPSFSDEYMFGSKTGDFVCEQCGRSFTKRQRDNLSQAANPRLNRFMQQKNLIKELLDTLSQRKGQLTVVAQSESGHAVLLLEALLQDQEQLILHADELIRVMDEK
ncbi:hypothetical protein [Porticoccus sp.]|uniref:hypothetical protein n=1 Tax=Porticoccus sp. TaxID=2024853 RepID=UPI003F6A0E35